MRRGLVALTTAILLGACDSGPEGPGTVTVFAAGPALGGVVLEVEGKGIQGFTALGSARVYAGEVPDRPDMHRVILISPDAGELAFEMSVQDRGMEGPVVRVVSATADDNTSMRSGEVDVRVQR